MYNDLILKEIRDANPTRSHDDLNRRLIKLVEEIGEVSEAYLSKTGSNYKNKTWDDLREEFVDAMIVMIDISYTPFPSYKFPAGAFVPIHFTEGKQHSAKTFPEMTDLIFEVLLSICSAQTAIASNEEIAFQGAVARGVKAVTSLCYASIPEVVEHNLDEKIYNLVVKKVNKWKDQQNLIVLPKDEVDVSDYLEILRDRM